MKSIKPGRGPSMMGAMGSVAAAVFGVIWIIAAVQMGAPGAFPLFGFVFIAIAVGQAVYHFRNAKGKNRYSVLDIVDSREEPDPLGHQLESEDQQEPASLGNLEDAVRFCPYCGTPVEADFAYCKSCGKKLPE